MTTTRSLSTRLRDWSRAHPRLFGVSIIAGALGLIGVAVILGTTLLSGVPVGQADGSPSPTSTPAPSATPTQPSTSPDPSNSVAPTPVPGPSWPPVAEVSDTHILPPMWVVSVVDDLNVRSGPGTEHPAIGQMDAGDVARIVDIAFGDAAGDWYSVAADGAIGYVNAGPVEDRYLLPTKTPWEPFLKELNGVASDGDVYLAYGRQFQADYGPYELHGMPSLALRSDDGMTWEEVEGPGSWMKSVAAADPGWVAILEIPLGGRVASFSTDGETWSERAGLGAFVSSVAYGPAGWVAVSNTESWISGDGRAWSLAADGLGQPSAEAEIESSDVGYVTFDRFTDKLQTSLDGATWTSVAHGGARVLDAELVSQRLFVVLADGEGATTVRRGRLESAGAVTWEGPAQAIDGPAFHVDRITQDDDGLLAVGWDEGDLLPLTWSSTDGAAWERLDTDGLQGVGAFEPTSGPAGWVGSNLEQSDDGASWVPPDPDPLAYDGPVPPCPPADKVSVITLSYLGPYAEGCLGDASVTIRGWVGELGFGGCCPPAGEPDWLASVFPPAILYSGEPRDVGANFQLIVYTPPDVDRSLLDQPNRRVEITGHYRDPASATCVSRPQRTYPNELASRASQQELCRQRFAVESIVEVAGP